jgi:hypothetical protein
VSVPARERAYPLPSLFVERIRKLVNSNLPVIPKDVGKLLKAYLEAEALLVGGHVVGVAGNSKAPENVPTLEGANSALKET